MEKFCINCKHADAREGYVACMGTHDVVTGKQLRRDARNLRAKGGACGPDGKLFEPKEVDVESRKKKIKVAA